MSGWRLEFRSAARRLARRKAFTLLAITTLGAGVAANTAVFGLLRGILLAPLPFERPERLVKVDVRSGQGYLISLSVPNFYDWRERNRSFGSFGASAGWDVILTGKGPAAWLPARQVLGDWFQTLGLRAETGRLFDGRETEPGRPPVAVLGHAAWTSRFGGDPGIVGQGIVLDGRTYTVVGVLAPGAGYPDATVEVYLSLGTLAAELPWDKRSSSFGLSAVGRLRPGLTPAAARDDLARVGQAMRAEFGPRVAIPETRPLAEVFVGEVRRPLLLLAGAVACVLAIAVANLAGLMIARAEGRRLEGAVRAALGGSRWALARPLMVESLLLALAGGVLGTIGGALILAFLPPAVRGNLPPLLAPQVGLGASGVLFALAISLLAAAVVALLPALEVRSHAPFAVLRGARGDTAGGQRRIRTALLVGEIALAYVLAVGAGLMVATVARLSSVERGFDGRRVVAASITSPSRHFADKPRWLAFYRQVLERTPSLPGVERAAFCLEVPLSGSSWENQVTPEEKPFVQDEGTSVLYNVVSNDYFAVLGVPLVEGRAFADGDRDGALPVVIIDETMARQFWPGQSALGKRLTIHEDYDAKILNKPPYRTVVGVVKNVRHYELASPSRIQAYVPLEQTLANWGMDLTVLASTRAGTSLRARDLSDLVAAIDPEAAVIDARPVSDFVAAQLARPRLTGNLVGALGILALGLATLGIFAVASYLVVQQTREIGVRLALGASGRDLVGWLARRAALWGGVGVSLGSAGAAALARLAQAQFFGVSPFEPSIYAAAGLALLGATALAIAAPAWAAVRVDPATALRYDA
jgi:predicted permease